MKTYKKRMGREPKDERQSSIVVKKKGGNLKGTESDLLFVQSCLVPTLFNKRQMNLFDPQSSKARLKCPLRKMDNLDVITDYLISI